jgi:lipoprotein-anchoring transpeptidase ErfK/SrfK
MSSNGSSIKKIKKAGWLFAVLAVCASAGLLTGCNGPQQPKQSPQQPKQQQTAKKADTTANTAVQPSAAQSAVTLPVLDALFYQPDFAKSLHTKIGLSMVQVQRLKTAAHASLRQLSEDGNADTVSAGAVNQRYQSEIKKIIGDDKMQQLQQLVADQYTQGVEGLAPTKPNFVPADTRVVVNAPAFRMDLFKDGKLIKTYRVGIGYPEFPLPTGMRRADTIIFNPAWTPPDEPWVRGKFQAGRKVLGGSELNPLGVIKIPIGLPSLIHGGKPLEKIGNYASHGCVGLTNPEVQDFTGMLAQLGGSDLTADAISAYRKHKNKTESVKLPKPVPIDLRYETIVAGNGTLHIYRDVYERGTNTLDNAKRILAAQGVHYDQLSDQEKSDLNDALDEMNRDPRGKPISTDSIPPSKNGVAASKIARSKKGKVTYHIKGQKEADVAMTELQGKGYPDPVDLNTGAVVKM